MTRHLLIVIAILCTAVPFAGQFYGDRAGGWLAIDFRAYYCAALAQREHKNPYFAQSIHRCERQTPAPFYRAPTNVSIPAPYPPYALAFLYPLTLLPFTAALAVWWTLLGLSLFITAYALARTTTQPFLVGWAAVVLALGLTSMTSGNVVPLAIAAIVTGGLLAQQRRMVGAALVVAFAMIEPQLALPAAVGLFIFAPGSRVALIACTVALILLSLATVGFTQTLGYVTQVLPAHALSEVSRDNQYSISTVLSAFGVPDASAVLAGSVSYALMAAIGLIVALRLARRCDEAALVVLLPPAISLLGGAFVHTGELAMAVPAALLLFVRTGAYRPWIFAAVILLAVPWMLSTSAAMFLAPFFPAAYLAWALWHHRAAPALAVALGSLALIAGLFALNAMHVGNATILSHAYSRIDPRLAEASWRELVLGNTTNRPIMWLLRIPSWIGLVALAATAIALAQNVKTRIVCGERAAIGSAT